MGKHLAEQFMEDALGRGFYVPVLDKHVEPCRFVRLAVERQVRDLETGAERGLHFDRKAAERACDFFGFLRHSKGQWAGNPFVLSASQAFRLWVFFGWKWADHGGRRFRIGYNEVPRKYGKSTEAAGVGLYAFDADKEAGAEIYSAATKRDQAKIVWSEAKRMVQKTPSLRKRIEVLKHSLSCDETDSFFIPLGADADSLDGLNPHCSLVDEIHAHRTRDLWDVLDTATGARLQPILWAITTAGFVKQGIGEELHDYAVKLLRGTIEDDRFFAFISTIDQKKDFPELLGLDEEGDGLREDDPMQPESWAKANPHLGLCCRIEDMEAQATKAKNSPASLRAFLVKRLNVWESGGVSWVNLEKWDTCGAAVDLDSLRGRTCYGGLDLSSTTDLTAFCLCFPPDDPEDEADPYRFLWRFFLPAETMERRSREDSVPYDLWVRQGFITPTPGNVVDQRVIQDMILEDAARFDLAEIAYDRWNASALVTNLLDEMHDDFMVPMGQGFASMSGPMKELETLYLAGRIAHGGNPVARWNASNLIADIDPAENIKPNKAKSVDRIDGMVAGIMALDRALRGEGGNPYEDRGLADPWAEEDEA